MARKSGSATSIEVNMAFPGDLFSSKAREAAETLRKDFPVTHVKGVDYVRVVDYDPTSGLSAVSAIITPKQGSNSFKKSMGWVGQVRVRGGGRVYTPDYS